MACGTGIAICPLPARGAPAAQPGPTGHPVTQGSKMANKPSTKAAPAATTPTTKAAPAATTLPASGPYTMPQVPQGAPNTVAKGTPATPGTLAVAMGMGYTVPASQQGATVALANTVWPQLGPGATVQVASHGQPGLVVHARTSTAAQPVRCAVPCNTMGGTKAALRLAVPATVLAAAQAALAGTPPTAAQAAAVATWLAQAAPTMVALPAAPAQGGAA